MVPSLSAHLQDIKYRNFHEMRVSRFVLLLPTNIYYSLEPIINISKEVVDMSANVETMFYTRVTPWHGLGTKVEEAPDSREALSLAGLDW